MNINNLIKCQDNERYSRRSCICIHGIESDNENVVEKVKRYYNALDLPFCEVGIDRVHRITTKYEIFKNKNSGKKVKSINQFG